MSFRHCWFWTIAFLTALLLANPARAENEGQADLDQATDLKLTAKNLDDLSQVIDLCETALRKGLDGGNTAFANSLLTGTLMLRAEFLSKRIVEQQPQGWPQLRVLALDDLEKALKVDPNLARAHLITARLQALQTGNRDLDTKNRAVALKAAELAFELSKDKPEAQVEALVLRANLSDDPQKRLEFYGQALKIAPQNQQALRERALFLLITGKPEEALTDLDAAIKADAENAETHQARGLALVLLKRNDEAIKAFSEAIKLAPDAAAPYLRRAETYNRDRKTKEALDDIAQVLKNDPDNVVALLLRSQIHQRAGDLKAARDSLDEALKNRQGLAPALLQYRAALAAESKDYRQAIDDLEKLRTIAPKNAELLGQLGMLYNVNKQPRKSIERYTAALTEAPQQVLALRGRGDSYLSVGKHAEAVADFDAALKIKPDDSGSLNNLAWVLATSPDDKVRDGKRSIELGTKAAEVTEYKEAHILSTLAAGYAETGDFEKAREWSRKAVELGSKEPEIGEQLKKELASYESNKPWREKQETPERDDSKQSPADSAAKPAPPDDSSVKKD